MNLFCYFQRRINNCMKNKNDYYSSISTVFCLVFMISSLSFSKEKLFNGFCSITPNDTNYDTSWHLPKIEANKAWEITTGSKAFSIGVVDSGINNISPLVFNDLSPNIDVSNSLDLSLDTNGSPFFDVLSLTTDGCHGTRVASILGAVGNNQTDIAGICWNANLASIRCSGLSSGIDLGDIATIFDQDDGNYCGFMPIMNMSFAIRKMDSQYNQDDANSLLTGISNYGGLIVASAGNEGINLDGNTNFYIQHKTYPACFDCDNIIVVGSSDQYDDQISSNYGQTNVDLFAPGVAINAPNFYSNDGGNTITYAGITGFGGTSAAAPLVAGTAALMKSVNPSLTALQIKQLIMNNVDHVTALEGLCVSEGRLNAYKAVKAAIPAYSTFGVSQNGVSILNPNEHQFYKVYLPTGIYSFSFNNSFASTCELYLEPHLNPFYSYNSSNGNLQFTLNNGLARTMYFKLINNGVNASSYSYSITRTGNHYHSYDYFYGHYSSTKHKAFCECGSYILQGHALNGNSNICVFCGEFVDNGFINPFGINIIVGNDSQLLNNGVIILGPIDYELIINNQITIEELIGGQLL